MRSKYLKVILLSLLIASIMIVPQIIKGNGILSIYSDYNFQQLPFAMSANEQIKEGNLNYTWTNDIGTSFIGTYSYYNLTSPFFLITLIFPASWYPYLIGPMLILKITVAALLAFIYLKRYIKNQDYAIVGALLYAFSGFQLTNLLFHFQDVIALFPLLLITLDKAMYENKKGLFALAIAVNAITNYFFFIGQVVFLVLYFIVKMITKEYKLNIKNFIHLAIESLIGVGLAAFIFIPSVIFVLGNPRVDSSWTLSSALLPRDYHLAEIFRGLLFAPEIMSERSLFYPYMFTSAELYLPFVGMILFTTFIWNRKNSWISILILTCFIFMIIPILNSTFFAFTTAYYARWFYMAILIMSLASAKALEEDIKLEHGYLTAGIVFAFFIILTLLFSLGESKVVYHFSYLLINILIALIGYIGLYIVYKFKNNKKLFTNLLLLGIIISASFQGFVFFYKYNAISNPKEYNDKIIYNDLEFDYLNDGERIDGNNSVDENLGYILNIPYLKNFNTTISGNAFKFYQTLGINRVVRTNIGENNSKLRDFLSTKYIITEKDEKLDEELVEKNKYYNVYKNKTYIGMGIPYEYYISKEDYLKLSKKSKQDILSYAVVLNKKQIIKYKKNLTKLEITTLEQLNDNYTQHVEKLSHTTASNFKYTTTGAKFKLTAERDTFIVLTIPYDRGWSVKVNGKMVSFEDVDYGLIGIKLKKGDNNIVLEYTPPGLTIGILISTLSIISLVGYLIIIKHKKTD